MKARVCSTRLKWIAKKSPIFLGFELGGYYQGERPGYHATKEQIMPHEITSGPQPNIVILRVYGDLTKDDLSVNEELGLNAGHVIYLLADLSKMSLGIPDNFLTTA